MSDRDDKQDIKTPLLATDDSVIPDELPPNTDMETTFEYMAQRRAQRLSVPRSKEFSRTDVMHAFQEAFELIGGVPRLAVWANDHESEFYRLYSKLFPNQMNANVKHAGEVRVVSPIPRTPLDEVTLEGEYKEIPDGATGTDG